MGGWVGDEPLNGPKVREEQEEEETSGGEAEKRKKEQEEEWVVEKEWVASVNWVLEQWEMRTEEEEAPIKTLLLFTRSILTRSV